MREELGSESDFLATRNTPWAGSRTMFGSCCGVAPSAQSDINKQTSAALGGASVEMFGSVRRCFLVRINNLVQTRGLSNRCA